MAGRPAKTYTHQLCTDTGSSEGPAKSDGQEERIAREREREREREEREGTPSYQYDFMMKIMRVGVLEGIEITTILMVRKSSS